MEVDRLLSFIDHMSMGKPKRLFLTSRNETAESKKYLEKFYMRLTLVLTRLKPYEGEFAPKATKILNTIVYKYGHAYKHHMFLRRARHSYSLARKLSGDKVSSLIRQIASGLSDSHYEYNLSPGAVEHASAVILHRIMMMDKLRIVCAKNVDFSIGYVELRHNINLNLLLIALAAELGSLALKQIRALAKTYNELSPCFSLFGKAPIPTLSELPVKSFLINEKNEIVERSTDTKRCDLEDFTKFLSHFEESEDALDELEIARLDEIYRILKSRPSFPENRHCASAEKTRPGFYREIPIKKRRKGRR